MFKKSRIVIALALVITLWGVLLTPVAFADEPPVFTKAAITKVLKVPVGTAAPTGNFTFTVTSVSVNSDNNIKPPVIGTLASPGVGTVTIAFPGATLGVCTCASACNADVQHYYKESGELFGAINWPSAGIYEYTIKENATFSGSLTSPNEVMTFSAAEYKVRVHVREYTLEDDIPAGKSVGDLYIYTIGAYRTTEESGSPGSDKVDPTPGGGSTTIVPFSQMTFNNIYTKHNGGGGTEPGTNNTLSVSKNVSGVYGSTTAYFDFSITVTKPSLVTGTPSYKAYIVENGVGLASLSANDITQSGSDAGGAYININSGSTLEFKLKHGQSLAFVNTHVGSSYTLSESGAAGYIASAVVTTNGTPGSEEIGTLDMGLAIPDGGNTFYTTAQLVGEAANKAAFKNTNNGSIETGLNISDLPFYGLILLAICGLATIVIVKARAGKAKD